jgi:hypothetical protein
MTMPCSFAVTSRSRLVAIARQAEGFLAPQYRPEPGEANLASPYVPFDSGVNCGFQSLAAKGYAWSASFNLRPRVRVDRARLLEEVEELASNQHLGDKRTITPPTLKTGLVRELETRSPRLRSQPLRNNEFTVQSSNSPMGRTK